MCAAILDGKETAKEIRIALRKRIAKLSFTPELVVILASDNAASSIYVRNKEKACEKVGITSRTIKMGPETTQKMLLECIGELNADPKVTGILLQLPLYPHLNSDEALCKIAPEKDVDGFHPINAGNLFLGQKGLRPCTPMGCMYMLKKTGIDLSGKKAVVLGRSNIVGKPMAALLLQENCTVTICHSRTKDLPSVTKEADILVAAIGKPRFVTGDMVKEGAVVLDVGINRLEDGTICGDVDFDSVEGKASYIAPVPGGVGPMTIAMLLENTVTAAEEYGKGLDA